MPVCAIEDLKDNLPRGARLCALDLGEKTVGLALSDSGLIVASPFETLRRLKFTQTALELEAIIEAHNVGGLVLGLPLNMDGTEGRRCQSTRQFAANLMQHGVTAPIVFWDERLSTVAVERVLIDEADLSRARRSEVVDKLAATYILQGALDRLRNL
ncbi:MAG: Holliday junction resolvase RuvX [Alphaproteobacteria bacterium]|nr:Holliday junction resolvase RuvX [Alphaproteobacteria bacterium]